MSKILFQVMLWVSQMIPQGKFGRWFFFSIVTPLYESSWDTELFVGGDNE